MAPGGRGTCRPERLWHLVYDTPEALLPLALDRAAAAGAGGVYVTDRAGVNPWDGMPAYLAAEDRGLVPMTGCDAVLATITAVLLLSSCAPSTSALPPASPSAPSAPTAPLASPSQGTRCPPPRHLPWHPRLASSRHVPGISPGAQRWVPAPGIHLAVAAHRSGRPDRGRRRLRHRRFPQQRGRVADLHRRGRKVVCYVEVGAAENFRPDYRAWPATARPARRLAGRAVARHPPARPLEPVLAERFDMCAAKGFDAVEPDLMDGLRQRHRLPDHRSRPDRFNRFVARLAHDRGLSVALKNDVEQVAELVGDFDFTVNEECAAFAECAALTPVHQGRQGGAARRVRPVARPPTAPSPTA